MSNNNSTGDNARIESVDALRGFALIGVGLVHALEQYTAAPHTEQMMQVTAAGLFDQIVSGIHMMLLTGKFYLIFSLLFGLSFFIQIDKPMRRNEPFAGRFAWRLAILFAIGYAHHFFYRADILMIYAMLGVSLLWLHRLPTRTLVLAALVMFFGLGRFISFSLFNDPLISHTADSPENLAYLETLKHGSLWEVMAVNSVQGLKHVLAFEFGVFGRAYVTFGLFLLGICLGRSAFFARLGERGRVLRKTLLWASVCTVASFALTAVCFALIGRPPDFTTWPEAVALTFYDLFNLSFSAVLSCLFLLALTGRKTGRFLLNAFAPYGRMALTNYLLQTAVGTALFYGWGLGLLGEWPARYLLAAGLAVAAGQILFSRAWMKHFHYGPVEWLWRTLTLRRRIRFRRTGEALSPAG